MVFFSKSQISTNSFTVLVSPSFTMGYKHCVLRFLQTTQCYIPLSCPQVCPMNMSPHVDPQKSGHEVWEEFSRSFTPAVREVVEFAKKIPGFRDLSQHDQVSLLKAGTFEVHYIFKPCATDLCQNISYYTHTDRAVFGFCRCW